MQTYLHVTHRPTDKSIYSFVCLVSFPSGTTLLCSHEHAQMCPHIWQVEKQTSQPHQKTSSRRCEPDAETHMVQVTFWQRHATVYNLAQTPMEKLTSTTWAEKKVPKPKRQKSGSFYLYEWNSWELRISGASMRSDFLSFVLYMLRIKTGSLGPGAMRRKINLMR